MKACHVTWWWRGGARAPSPARVSQTAAGFPRCSMSTRSLNAPDNKREGRQPIRWQQRMKTDLTLQTSPCPRSASCTPEQPRWSPPDGTHNPLGRSLPLVFLPPRPPPSPCCLQREEEHQDPRSSSLQTQVGSPEGTAPPSPTPATHIQTGVKQKHTPHPSAGFLQPANQRKVRVWVIWRRSSGDSSLFSPPRLLAAVSMNKITIIKLSSPLIGWRTPDLTSCYATFLKKTISSNVQLCVLSCVNIGLTSSILG